MNLPVVDQNTDVLGSYETHWECEPPSRMTVSYRVIEQEWNEDYTVRTIKRIEFV